MDKELESVLSKIKDSYIKQVASIEAQTTVLEEKLKAYKSAARSDVLSEFLERNGLPSPERKSEVAALALYEAISDLPEFKPLAVEVPDVPETEEEELPVEAGPVETLRWPLLAVERPVLFFGGYVNEEKIAKIGKGGAKVDWISNEGGARAAGLAQRVSDRIRNGTYCAMVLMNELSGHSESNALFAACRASETPFAMGKKGGIGQLFGILDEFERRLAKK